MFMKSSILAKGHFAVLLLLLLSGQRAAADNCEIVSYNTQLKVKGSRIYETVEVTVQVNSREGEECGYEYVLFNDFITVVDIEAWVSDKEGKVVKKLKKAEIGTASAVSDAALYQDNFVKHFYLKHNTYPYQVHYSYTTVRSEYLYVENWHPTFNRLYCHRASLSLEVPEGFDFQLFERNIEKAVVTHNDDKGLVTYNWRAENVKGTTSEVLAPDAWAFQPLVMIKPARFSYGLEGSLNSWEDFGNWQYQTNAGLRELPDFEKKNIDRLIADTPDKREQVRKIYHYLQDQTRYILVAEGIGGLKPYPADYVAKNKFGDCKALTNYMMAALEYIGISSYFTIIRAGSQMRPLIKTMPGPQFDHVIVNVPMEQDTIWLECTSKYNPFGYLGTFTQNREALLVSETGSRIVRTPALKVEEVTEVRKLYAVVGPNGKTKVTINLRMKGDESETFSRILREFKEIEQERYVRQLIPYPEYTLSGWQFIKTDRDDPSVTLNIELVTDSFLKSYGNDYVVKPPAFDLPKLETPAKRKLPLQLPYPIHQVDSIFIQLGEGFRIGKLPVPESIATASGSYVNNASNDGSEIVLTRNCVVYGGTYETEKYPDFYNFISAVNKSESSNVLIVNKK